MGRLMHFELHASDPQKAIAFYSAVFGWNFQPWEGPMEYWLIMTGDPNTPGIDGGLMRRQGPAPPRGSAVNAFVCTMSVEDLDATTALVIANGGDIALPKMPVPGIGWIGYFHDLDGNLIGAMQLDPQAA